MIARVTMRRTKKDFAFSVRDILDAYPHLRKLDLVLDNLSTYFAKAICETF